MSYQYIAGLYVGKYSHIYICLLIRMLSVVKGGEIIVGERRDYIDFFKKNSWHLAILFLFILGFFFNNQLNQLYGVFGERNYVMIHLLIEIFIIITSFTIAIQAWLIFPYILSNYRLYIGALFLAVGFFELIHTFAYKGMPFFIRESSTYSASWFYMLSRLTQALGILMFLILKPRKVHRVQRWIVYSLACLYVVGWVFIIFYPSQLLPTLVIEGVGTTALKNGLQYAAMVVQVVLVVYLWKNTNVTFKQNAMIIIASLYLILSDLMFTTYKSVYDIRSFMGHVFQLLTFTFSLGALYYTSVEKPFQSLIATQKQLNYMAYHDELTKLPNSRFFTEKLTKELKIQGTNKAIMMIEIDRLKSFNESFGHSFRDILVQKVAVRLRESLPSDLFISKLRAGEFTIILHSVKNKEDVIKVCKQIQEGMKETFQIQHFQLTVTLNMGVAAYPDHGESEDELLKHAQVAMREAQKVTERYLFYRSEMDQQLDERLLLEHDLHGALEKGEFYLEYQPQVDVHTGRIYAVEALIRWKHPEKGWISPATFIPLAEETGLIVPIGEWVLETACRQAKQWHDEGIPKIGVAVNLSIRQFFQQNLVQMVEGVLMRTNLAASYLELEITESMTMDTRHAIKILHDLKRLGVKIAIDDFGNRLFIYVLSKRFSNGLFKNRSFICS